MSELTMARFKHALLVATGLLAVRRDGKWRIIRDIWNSDNAPATPAQAASAN